MLCQHQYPRSRLWLLLLVLLVTVMNSSGVTAVMTLFLLHRPLEWTPLYIGGFLGMSEFIHGLVLVVVLPLLLSAGVNDGAIVSLSITLTISMNLILGFVNKTWQVFLVGVFQSAEVLIVPTLKAMLTKAVPVEEKGKLFAFVTVVQVVGTMLGSLVYITVYILFIMMMRAYWVPDHYSGASFIIMAIVYTLTLPFMSILSLSDYIARRRNRNNHFLSINDNGSSSYVDNGPSFSNAESIHSRPQSQHQQGRTPQLSPQREFDVSIGQEVLDREGSIQTSLQRQRSGDQEWDWEDWEERNKDFLDHSYSGLSDYHANK